MSGRDSWSLREGDAITAELTAMRLLGGGSAYEAYLAFDEITYAPVVVKVLRPEPGDDRASLRGLDARSAALAAVNHPGVVRGLRHVTDGDRARTWCSSTSTGHGSRPWSVATDRSRPSSTCRWPSTSRRRCTTSGTSARCTSTSSRATSSWARRRGSSTCRSCARSRRRRGSTTSSAPTPTSRPSRPTPAGRQCRARQRRVGPRRHAVPRHRRRAAVRRGRPGRGGGRAAPPAGRRPPSQLPRGCPARSPRWSSAGLAPRPGRPPAPHEVAEVLQPVLERLPRARLTGFGGQALNR